MTGITTEEMMMKAMRLLTGSPRYDVEGVKSSGFIAETKYNKTCNFKNTNTSLEMFHSQIYQMLLVEGSFPIQGDV